MNAPEEVRFPIDRNYLVCDVDVSRTEKVIPIIICQIPGEGQTIVHVLLAVLENTESPGSMTKTVVLNGITPDLVEVPGMGGEGGAREDGDTVPNFDLDEHVLRGWRNPDSRRGDG